MHTRLCIKLSIMISTGVSALFMPFRFVNELAWVWLEGKMICGKNRTRLNVSVLQLGREAAHLREIAAWNGVSRGSELIHYAVRAERQCSLGRGVVDRGLQIYRSYSL
jgi:hypothetical protein